MLTRKTALLVACLGPLLVAAVWAAPARPAGRQNLSTTVAGPATIPGSEVLTFKSGLNGNEYELFVFLPEGYGESKRSYPVLYLLDGNAWQSAYGAIQRLRMGDDIPPMILVGVGYQGPTLRQTDYPTVAHSYWDVPADRGAPVFLRVLKEEVIPRIEGRYRTDPAGRGLGGHSMGGYFTLFTLFNSPETFQRYWVSSPSIVWDRYVIFQHEQAYAKTHQDLRARVFVDEGELESSDVSGRLLDLQRTVEARKYPHLSWFTQIVPELAHNAVPTVAFPYALYYLYGRPTTQLSGSRLAQLTGRYKLSDQGSFRLESDGKNLYLVDFQSKVLGVEPPLKHLRLLAENADTLFARYIGLNFAVLPGQGERPSRLVVTQQPSSDSSGVQSPPAVTAERVPD